jgi:hypothetical protein
LLIKVPIRQSADFHEVPIRQSADFHEDGLGQCKAGPAMEKMAHDDFPILNSFFQLNNLAGEK